MQKRNFLVFGMVLSLSLVITQISLVHGVNFVEDSVNDVMKFEDGIYVGKGDYHDEVDIVSLTFVNENLTLTLQANPIFINNDHLYEVIIVWDSINTYQNETIISIGSLNGNPFSDVLTHTVVNSTGDTLASQPSPIYNSTIIKANTLIWQLDVTLFNNMSYPEYVNATAQYTINEGGKDVLYLDTHLEGEGPGFVWNFNTILSILGTILVCGFAGYTLGSITVYYLTSNVRAKQNNTIFMAVFVIGLAVLVNYWFWLTPLQLIWNIGVFILTLVFGFYWATRGIMRLKFDSPLPDNLPIDTDEEKTAVLVLAKGEAEEYNPLALIRKYYKKEETGVKQKHKLFQPFEFFKVKRKYRQIIKGQTKDTKDEIKIEVPGNPYRKIMRSMVSKLDESFLDYDMYQEVFVDDWPTINQGLLTAISRGSSKITILNLFMSENFEYELAIQEMKKIDYSKINIIIEQTDFLARNEALQDLIAKKILEKIPKDSTKSEIGVILVSEGQPEEWDKLYPTTEEENHFRDKIKKKLIAGKILEENIAYAWIENRSPTLKEAFDKLATNNCQTIIYIATSIPIDGVETIYTLPVTLNKLAQEKNIKIIQLNAWNDDKDVIQIYLSLITNAKELPLQELGKTADIVLQSTKVGAKLEDAADVDSKEENTD
ncbi:MAG: hypothetical protein JXA54_07940 [Candidatus Heimdallarchaeota archaeon]|nr:hypothetical protein [Candidatus Heimdallarchaeota archaeon]